MNVYRVEGDGDYFGVSLKDRRHADAIMDSDHENKPLAAGIVLEGDYYSDEPKTEPVLTDFGYYSYGTTLLLRQPRTAVLRPMLAQVGTILPMTPWKGYAFEMFVCDTQIDAIDPAGMVYYPEEHEFFGGREKQYAFKADAVRDATVFRAKGQFGILFATDRFLDLVRRHGLTGLQVLPLWSSDTGPLTTIEDPMAEFERFPPGFGTNKHEKRAAMRALLEEQVRHQATPPPA